MAPSYSTGPASDCRIVVSSLWAQTMMWAYCFTDVFAANSADFLSKASVNGLCSFTRKSLCNPSLSSCDLGYSWSSPRTADLFG